MIKIVKNINIQSLVFFLLCLFAVGMAQATTFVPRVGLAGGIYWTEDSTNPTLDSEDGASVSAGFNAGVAMVMQDSFLDLTIEAIKYDVGLTAPVDTGQPNDGWRSELNITGGYRLVGNVFGFVGLRDATWGESIATNDGAAFRGVYLGVSVNNLEVDRDLMSITVGQVFGDWETDFATADAEGALFKISWREKGTKELWSVKWTSLGQAINDQSVMFGYTYLFI